MATTLAFTASTPFAARALTQSAAAQAQAQVSFSEGVGSGDPESDSVILWTRAVPPSGEQVSLVLQVSEYEDLRELVLEATVVASASDDFTVRARVDGLKAGQHYFYRFFAAAGGRSRLGRTMTAPAAAAESAVNLAFASCQNFEQGYYGAWARMVADDQQADPEQQIQCVVHLGDFIYERYRHAATEGQTFVRQLAAFPDGRRDDEREWAHSLADYRHLYIEHLRDPHLQDARARWPFVCTWDDHEFSNNGFREYSYYTDQPVAEPQRRSDAHQAWFEYIPARVDPTTSPLRIFRRLNWGACVDLVVTDLRSYRSDPTVPDGLSSELGLASPAIELVEILDAGRNYNNGKPPQNLPFGSGDTPNPAFDRAPASLMGQAQKNWFKDTLNDSTAPWKVWVNSLPLLPMRLDLGSLPLPDMHDSILSADAWAGFPGEYRELMRFVHDQGITGLVSLSGDHHSHGVADLHMNPNDPDSAVVAADFNVTGISSTPQFAGVRNSAQSSSQSFRDIVAGEDGERIVTVWNLTLSGGVLAAMAYARTGWKRLSDWLGPNTANPGLKYFDSDSNGYGLARFDSERCQVTLVTTTPAADPTAAGVAAVRHRANFELPVWSKTQEPRIVGPTFDGSPPFPWA